MQLLGIEFVPLNTPIQERIETLAVGLWFITFALGPFISFGCFIYLLLTPYRLWMILYLLWMMYDRRTGSKGGRPIQCVRSMTWWRYVTEYFSMELVYASSEPLDPDRNYLVCPFPHGIMPAGIFGAFGTNHLQFKKYFPRHECRGVLLWSAFYVPFYRDLLTALGCITSNFESILYTLNNLKGVVCCISVGGAKEAFLCKPGHYTFLLKNRKGFVKAALLTGTPLMPCILFGEPELFKQYEGGKFVKRVQALLQKYLTFAPVLVTGRGLFQYSFGLVPRKAKITVVGMYFLCP